MKYNVNIDLGAVLNGVNGHIMAAALPTISQAIRAVAAETAYRWKDGVAKAHLWEGEKQPYIESIRWMMVGEFSALVSSDYELASDIETGRPARDMKKVLNTSMKVRVAKHGKHTGQRYLIIPFRHQTPGNFASGQAMPAEVYKKAKQLDASTVTGTGVRVSGTGAMGMKSRAPVTVPQQSYKWGGRLPAGLSAKLKDHHATHIHNGMVRFKTSAGGGKSSTYLTFRVMGEWSSGWISPAKPGLYLAKKVTDDIAQTVPRVFGEAIKRLK